MAATCPLASCCRPSREGRCTYDHVARDPGGDFHYHRGPRYAADYLRYDADELASLPEACTARFAGVGNPLRIGLGQLRQP